jgi:arylsulfatase A-like enzyme
MIKIKPLILIATLLLSLFVAAQEERKNILFIAIDDLKPVLGSYGSEQMVTPHIDKLAENGVIFTNAHCQQAVCGPSRASLMTGMRPDYTGVWDLRTRMRHVNEDILAMPQHFKNNGYTTVAIGKIYDPRCVDKQYDEPSWSVPYSESSTYTYPEEYGEPALTYYADEEAKKTVAALRKEAREKEIKNVHAYVAEHFKPSVENTDVPDDAYIDGQIANNALRYMEELSDKEEPFFLAVGFKRPHLPFAAPTKYWDLYERDEIKLADYQKPVEDGVDIAYHTHGELQSYSDIPPVESFSDIFTELIPEDKQRELIHGYYASTSFIDAQVGKIMSKLKELGLDKNTVIVLWGDHGWHLGDHALWCKHTNFEQATRVPLIFSTPNGETGTYSHPAEFVDVFPTLCEASGVAAPETLQGVSLVPAMKNTDLKLKEYAVSQFDRGKTHGYSIRTNRYRLTVWMKDDYRTFMPFDSTLIHDCELYDYAVDSNETRNLYRSEEHQEIVLTMMDQFKDYVKKQNIELKEAGSNPVNKKASATIAALKVNEDFGVDFDKNWHTSAKNGAIASFDVLEGGPLGENTLKIEVEKMGEKNFDVGMRTVNRTPIEKGKEVNISFSARGGKMRVILVNNEGDRVYENLEPGSNTFLHRVSFKLPASGDWNLKFVFMEKGTYYLYGVKSEIE